MLNWMSVDKLLVFYLSPAALFLVSLTQSSWVNYFMTGYAMSYVLIILILYRISKNETSISKFIPIILVFSLCALEYINFMLSGVSLNGMNDIRMILYSPLYAPIIVFTLYATYLLASPEATRVIHLNITIKLFTYFNVFFIFYWISLYFGLIPQIEFTNYLNANPISYASLFVIFSLIGFKDLIQIKSGTLKYYLLINTLVVFLNTTRGAILILFVTMVYYTLRSISMRISRPLLITIITLLTVMVVFLVLKQNLGDIIFGEAFIALSEQMGNIRKDVTLDSIAVEFDRRGAVHDDSSVSSIGRIFTNYSAIILFLEYPWIGIGSAYAYSIKVLGIGIHSFTFLLLVSTGIIGMSLFIATIISISTSMRLVRDKFVLLSFGLFVLLFINNFPAYFVLLFVLGAGINIISKKN
jgi:hypothetical protein